MYIMFFCKSINKFFTTLHKKLSNRLKEKYKIVEILLSLKLPIYEEFY